MAKTLYFTQISNLQQCYAILDNPPNLAGTAVWWGVPRTLLEYRSPTPVVTTGANSVRGPTVGLSRRVAGASWEPHSRFHDRGNDRSQLGLRTAMSDNMAVNAAIYKVDGVTQAVTQIAKSARVTELAVTTSAVNNFTVTPTSTAFKRGDRIWVRIFFDDAGTMAAGELRNHDLRRCHRRRRRWLVHHLHREPDLRAARRDRSTAIHRPTASLHHGIGNSWRPMLSEPFHALESTICEVRCRVNKTGAPTDNLVVELRTDSPGLPSSTVVATLGTTPASSITVGSQTILTYPNLTISGLTVGALYHVVWRRSGTLSDTDYYGVYSASANPSWGNGFIFNGTSWVNSNSCRELFMQGPTRWRPLPHRHRLCRSGSRVKGHQRRHAAAERSPRSRTRQRDQPRYSDHCSGGGTRWSGTPHRWMRSRLAGKFTFYIRAVMATGSAGCRGEIAVVNGDGQARSCGLPLVAGTRYTSSTALVLLFRLAMTSRSQPVGSSGSVSTPTTNPATYCQVESRCRSPQRDDQRSFPATRMSPFRLPSRSKPRAAACSPSGGIVLNGTVATAVTAAPRRAARSSSAALPSSAWYGRPLLPAGSSSEAHAPPFLASGIATHLPGVSSSAGRLSLASSGRRPRPAALSSGAVLFPTGRWRWSRPQGLFSGAASPAPASSRWPRARV